MDRGPPRAGGEEDHAGPGKAGWSDGTPPDAGPPGADAPAPGRFLRHVFVCTAGPNCPRDGDPAGIHAELKRRAKAEGLDVRVNKSGCLGQCGHGPMAVVYPEAVWYSHLRLEDTSSVLEHLRLGTPATRLAYGMEGHGTRDEPRRADGAVDRGHPDFRPCARC